MELFIHQVLQNGTTFQNILILERMDVLLQTAFWDSKLRQFHVDKLAECRPE